MIEPLTISVRPIARSLRISIRQVEAVAQLLEEGKSVPFIARYRKEQTGGLEEEQVRRIRRSLAEAQLLAQRKQTILRTIQLQGRLTPELEAQIQTATTSRRLEDLYLPYKPKKEGLAAAARTRGLEPLAEEILQAAPSCANLDARAADFVNPDKQVRTPADALLGAGHILAEMISEYPDLRKKLREVFYKTGRICSKRLETVVLPPGWEAQKKSAPSVKAKSAEIQQTETSSSPETVLAPVGSSSESPPSVQSPSAPSEQSAPEAKPFEADTDARTSDPVSCVEDAHGPGERVSNPSEESSSESAGGIASQVAGPSEEVNGSGVGLSAAEVPPTSSENADPFFKTSAPSEVDSGPSSENLSGQAPGEEAGGTSLGEKMGTKETFAAEGRSVDSSEADTTSSDSSQGETIPPADPSPSPPAADSASGSEAISASSPRLTPAELRRQKRELKKQRELERRLREYEHLFDFQEPLRKISPYRILVLNRAERQNIVQVWIECDQEAMKQVLFQECIPPDHPHADFLRGCAEDALVRLILPSFQREARRELTEKAENHAVEVFAKLLRKMLLQRPVRGKRILAVDPGLRNGCVFAALDEFGNVLDHGKFYFGGRLQRREEIRQKLIQLIRRYRIGLVVIGTGPGARIVEEFMAELVHNELKTEDIRYGIVSSIGAGFYGASSVGQEEFPHYDARLRAVISIGRRVLDPLSELVKIEPAQLAIGTYQHDVKAKHLQPLLEEVVESCVNRVGVDVNRAHPWLLQYVSGLNMVLARRLEEYRREHGAFRCRTQLKEVPGFGEGTFELAAGFLRIAQGPEPLDQTAIHPESYELARKILEKVSARPEDLWTSSASEVSKRLGQLNAETVAQELAASVWTVRQVLGELRRAGRDIREDAPLPMFKRARLQLEELTPDMELTGTVVHITTFGAFVDIGLNENGLVHISQMASQYVRDPREVVSVGDTVKVWVLQVDVERRRISLSMIPPDLRAQAAQQSRPPKTASDRAGKGASAPGGKSLSPAGASGGERTTYSRPPRASRPGKKGGPTTREFRSKSPAPPAPKLSEAVKQGKQPMRTFAELLQFFQLSRQQQSAAQPAPSAAPPAPSDQQGSSPSQPASTPAEPFSAQQAVPSAAPPSPEAARQTPVAQPPAEPADGLASAVDGPASAVSELSPAEALPTSQPDQPPGPPEPAAAPPAAPDASAPGTSSEKTGTS